MRWPRWVVHVLPRLDADLPHDPADRAGRRLVHDVPRTVGLDNTLTGLILAHATLNLPMALWLMSVFVRDVPRGAGGGGAHRRRVARRVLLRQSSLPLVAPGLAATAVLTFVFTWNEFAVALTLSTKQTATVPVAIAKFAQDYEIQYTQMAASAALSIAPALIAAAGRPALHRQGPDAGRRQMIARNMQLLESR